MKVCPTCNLAGDSLGECGNFLTCGAMNAVEVDPAKFAVITCNEPTCNKTAAVPVEEIMQSRIKRLCQAGRDGCKASVISIVPKASKTASKA